MSECKHGRSRAWRIVVNGLRSRVVILVLSALMVIAGGPCTNLHCCSESVHHNNLPNRPHADCCALLAADECASTLDQGQCHCPDCCCTAFHLPPALQSYGNGDDLGNARDYAAPAFILPVSTFLVNTGICPASLPAEGPPLKSVRSTVLLI